MCRPPLLNIRLAEMLGCHSDIFAAIESQNPTANPPKGRRTSVGLIRSCRSLIQVEDSFAKENKTFRRTHN